LQGCVVELLILVSTYAVVIGVSSAVVIGVQIITLVLAGIMFMKADELA